MSNDCAVLNGLSLANLVAYSLAFPFNVVDYVAHESAKGSVSNMFRLRSLLSL